MRLLVAEDEQPIRDLLVRPLSEVGYIVDAAENGGDGLHLLRMHNYAAASAIGACLRFQGSMWSGRRDCTTSRYPF